MGCDQSVQPCWYFINSLFLLLYSYQLWITFNAFDTKANVLVLWCYKTLSTLLPPPPHQQAFVIAVFEIHLFGGVFLCMF